MSRVVWLRPFDKTRRSADGGEKAATASIRMAAKLAIQTSQPVRNERPRFTPRSPIRRAVSKNSGNNIVDRLYLKGGGSAGKAIALGILERETEDKLERVRATVIPDRTKPVMQENVRPHVGVGFLKQVTRLLETPQWHRSR
jgi:hypothetical protein